MRTHVCEGVASERGSHVALTCPAWRSDCSEDSENRSRFVSLAGPWRNRCEHIDADERVRSFAETMTGDAAAARPFEALRVR